jgi:hypothetical protein
MGNWAEGRRKNFPPTSHPACGLRSSVMSLDLNFLIYKTEDFK